MAIYLNINADYAKSRTAIIINHRELFFFLVLPKFGSMCLCVCMCVFAIIATPFNIKLSNSGITSLM